MNGSTEQPASTTAGEAAWQLARDMAAVYQHSGPCSVAGEVPESVAVCQRAIDAALAAASEREAGLRKERKDLVELIQKAEREACIDQSDDDTELWRIVESFFSRARELWQKDLQAANAMVAELEEMLSVASYFDGQTVEQWRAERQKAESDLAQARGELGQTKTALHNATTELQQTREQLAKGRAEWPYCDGHSLLHADSDKGHCPQCGVEREKALQTKLAAVTRELEQTEADRGMLTGLVNKLRAQVASLQGERDALRSGVTQLAEHFEMQARTMSKYPDWHGAMKNVANQCRKILTASGDGGAK